MYFISNQLPGDADATKPWTTLWLALAEEERWGEKKKSEAWVVQGHKKERVRLKVIARGFTIGEAILHGTVVSPSELKVRLDCGRLLHHSD